VLYQRDSVSALERSPSVPPREFLQLPCFRGAVTCRRVHGRAWRELAMNFDSWNLKFGFCGGICKGSVVRKYMVNW